MRWIRPPLSISAPRDFCAAMIFSVSSSRSGTKRSAIVIIIANSCTGTCSSASGFKSRSIASVSCVGEVVNVRIELMRISTTMRTAIMMLFKMPFIVIVMKPSFTSGSPVP